MNMDNVKIGDRIGYESAAGTIYGEVGGVRRFAFIAVLFVSGCEWVDSSQWDAAIIACDKNGGVDKVHPTGVVQCNNGARFDRQ